MHTSRVSCSMARRWARVTRTPDRERHAAGGTLVSQEHDGSVVSQHCRRIGARRAICGCASGDNAGG
jgi:hypothetical protein